MHANLFLGNSSSGGSAMQSWLGKQTLDHDNNNIIRWNVNDISGIFLAQYLGVGTNDADGNDNK